jgi:hypothetical protein
MRAAAAMVRDMVMPPRAFLDLGPEHTFDTPPRPVDQVITSMRNGDLARVGRDQALSVAAVQRGRNEVCAIATLPLRLYRGLDVLDSALFRQFDPDVPNVVHMAMTLEDLAFESIAWWEVTSKDFANYPASVRRIDPAHVRLTDPGGPSSNTTLPYLQPLSPSTTAPRDQRWVWVDYCDGRGWQKRDSSLMIRFDSPNPGLLKANARAIRIAIKLDRLTEMYAENPALREFFTDNPDFDGDPYEEDEIDTFLAEYGAMRQNRPYGWLPGQVKRSDVNAPSPKDLTLADLQDRVNVAIANGIGVDPEDLGVSTTSRTYFNSVDKKQDKINRVYAPYMAAITDRLSMGDVTVRGQAARFDLVDYLKSDPVTQATYWKVLKELGVTDAAEIRGWAGLTGPPPTAPAPAVPVDVSRETSLAAVRAGRRFDGDGPAHRFAATDFETPPPAPAVDEAARTITGLAVPYGVPTQRYGVTLKFDAGSLEYSSPERMAHLQDHGTPVGFHRSITDGPAGPTVALAVLDGPPGSPQKAQRDGLLYDAANGLYTGLSVGVDFSMFPEDGDVVVDDDGVYHVVRAQWRETSTTYMPQFDDARVTSVAASRTGGTTVDCPYCHGPHATNISCATFAARQPALVGAGAPAPAPAPGAPAGPPPLDQSALFAQFTAWQQAQAHPALAAAPAGPTPVNAHHTPAQVTEPSPYRFDRRGNLRAGSHDFSSDLLQGWREGGGGAQASRDRAQEFVQAYFEGLDQQAQQQFAITPANVANLNYPQNHPEWYVDQLEFQYPLYNATNKGTLDAVTPFVIPKFSSSSGLVADHVTGTEPTPGTFVATAQTLTPSAVSGKVEITREAVDQGGNPQMSGLIWRQMVRGWYEALEAFIQAQLVAAAASIPDITITALAVDGPLDQAISAAMVPLQYIRGGDVFSDVFTQIDLYKAMVAAKDSTGRRLYPTLNPQNSGGQTSRGYAQIDAHGKIWTPAWATAATGSVAASSWMFDKEVVCLWASAPKQIDIVWRVAWVDMGLFGYKAFGITDFTRTREVIYDPS